VRGTQAGQENVIRLYDEFGNPLAERPLSAFGGAPPVGAWTLYTIPLSELGATNRPITGLAIQNPFGTAQPTLYIDEVYFSSP
jgi:hypothetical protein